MSRTFSQPHAPSKLGITCGERFSRKKLIFHWQKALKRSEDDDI